MPIITRAAAYENAASGSAVVADEMESIYTGITTRSQNGFYYYVHTMSASTEALRLQCKALLENTDHGGYAVTVGGTGGAPTLIINWPTP